MQPFFEKFLIFLRNKQLFLEKYLDFLRFFFLVGNHITQRERPKKNKRQATFFEKFLNFLEISNRF